MVELAFFLQKGQVLEPDKFLPFERFKIKVVPLVGGVKFLDPFQNVPGRLEVIFQNGVDLGEINLICPGIGPMLAGIFDAAAGNDLFDRVGQVFDLVILAVLADVEDLVVDQLFGSLQGGDKSATEILDVDQRPPGGAVAHDLDLPGGVTPGGQIVDDQVEAEERRSAVNGGVPHEDRGKIIISQRRDPLLGPDLRFANPSFATP